MKKKINERYSDKDLATFKVLIEKKLKNAQEDLLLMKKTLSNKDNNGTDDTATSFKFMEESSGAVSKEKTSQLAARQERFILHLENALLRIKNKTYGICRVTGKLISKERLKSVPHATLSKEAKDKGES